MGRFYIAIAVVFIATFLSEKTLANIIIAEAGNSGKTIANAIQSAQNGDTVLIKSGIYKEQSLKLKKSITLLGENLPVIDGENKYENLTVEHDSVIIKGIKFINSGSSNFNDIAALTIQNSKHLLIEDCQFENNFFGILSMNCGYITYNNNKLSSGGIKGKPLANGIHCWKSNHLTITNNTIKGHRDGIYLEFTTQSKFENNRSIKNSRYGMHFMFSHDNFYQHNEFIANGAGVAVMYSKRVEMRYNLFADSWGSAAYGVLLKEINDSKIIGNEFRGNTISIFADGANRIEIYNNLFLKGGWGVKV
ncbi:MAG TPA: NosD domain-containing protein, partial [Chitinophagales bacterium]|nr:NosD domain-containing protein [Chitinophagales bacterium]